MPWAFRRRVVQCRSTALDVRRQDARRGLCYPGKRGEIGGVIEPRIHNQAAKLARKADNLLVQPHQASRLPRLYQQMLEETVMSLKAGISEPVAGK
jgi:hypothetical protein